MTKKELEEYQKLKTDIKCLENEIKELLETDKGIVIDTVLDYRSGYGVPTGIRGFNQRRYNELRKRLDKKQDKLQKIEKFIDDIADDTARMVFRLKYMEGKTFQQIAFKIGKHDESYPRQYIHNKFLKKIKVTENTENTELE